MLLLGTFSPSHLQCIAPYAEFDVSPVTILGAVTVLNIQEGKYLQTTDIVIHTTWTPLTFLFLSYSLHLQISRNYKPHTWVTLIKSSML